jgi:hypothetical protein
MSIAELIMTGTERASKSTDWVADSLAKIGDNVTKVLTEREQNRQAQEMLPFLKQNLQAAMTDAQNGKPGQAYSKLLGSLDTQTLNNPQLADFVKLGFNAIGQTMDAQKTGGTSLVDFLVAKELGLPMPTGGDGTPSDALNSTTPLSETANQAGEAIMNPVVEPGDDATKQPMPGLPVVTSKQPLTYAEAAKAKAAKPTPAQEKATEFVYKNEAIAETQGVPKAWYNEAIDPASPKIKELTQTHEPVDLQGTDKFGFGTMYVPIQRDQEMNITGKGNDFNFSKTVNRRNPQLEGQRIEFIQNMNNALSILDGSAEMQTLLDQYGSIDNFPKYKTGKDGIVFPLKDGKKSITLRKGTQEQPGLMESWRTLQNAPGMGRAIGILIARSGEASGSSSRSKENLAELLR